MTACPLYLLLSVHPESAVVSTFASMERCVAPGPGVLLGRAKSRVASGQVVNVKRQSIVGTSAIGTVITNVNTCVSGSGFAIHGIATTRKVAVGIAVGIVLISVKNIVLVEVVVGIPLELAAGAPVILEEMEGVLGPEADVPGGLMFPRPLVLKPTGCSAITTATTRLAETAMMAG